MGFFSPPLLSWKEPVAYRRGKTMIKALPDALIVTGKIDVYEHQVLQFSGGAIVQIPFKYLVKCTVTPRETDGERFFVLTLTSKDMGFWAFSYNFLKETAVGDAEVLERFTEILRKNGVAVT